MHTVHYSQFLTVTRTGGQPHSVCRPSENLPSAEVRELAYEEVRETKRTGWPVSVQLMERYTACHSRTPGDNNCGHCRSGMPHTQISNAKWYDSNGGSGKAHVVSQELYASAADVPTTVSA